MKYKAFIIKTIVYKSGDTSVKFYVEFCDIPMFFEELSGGEFVKCFDLIALDYSMCYLDSFADPNVFSVGVIKYAVKEKIE